VTHAQSVAQGQQMVLFWFWFCAKDAKAKGYSQQKAISNRELRAGDPTHTETDWKHVLMNAG
jgi:hypothetical protein